jgi:hypothetical protein
MNSVNNLLNSCECPQLYLESCEKAIALQTKDGRMKKSLQLYGIKMNSSMGFLSLLSLIVIDGLRVTERFGEEPKCERVNNEILNMIPN